MNILSFEQLNFFKAKGYLHIKGMLSDEEISKVDLDSFEMIEPIYVDLVMMIDGYIIKQQIIENG